MELTTQSRKNKDTRSNARTLANYLKRKGLPAKQPKARVNGVWDVNLTLDKHHTRKQFVVIQGKAVQENLLNVGR